MKRTTDELERRLFTAIDKATSIGGVVCQDNLLAAARSAMNRIRELEAELVDLKAKQKFRKRG